MTRSPFLRGILLIGALAWIVLLAACGDSTTPDAAKAGGRGPSGTAGVEAPPIPTIVPGPGDWPQDLHDLSKSGSSPDTSLTPPLALGWKFKTGGSIVGGPIVARGTVYVGSKDGRLYALPADKWGERWRFQAGAGIHFAPVYADGVVVFTDDKGTLHGVDAATGEPLWEKSLPTVTGSAPVYAGGRVWLGMHPNTLVAFDRGTGAKVDTRRTRSTIGGVSYATANGILRPQQPVTASIPESPGGPSTRSQPVVAAGITYVGYRDGSVRAYDASGAQVWTTTLPAPIDGTPAIADGRLYVPCADGALYVFVNEDAAPSAVATRDTVTVVLPDARTYSAPNAPAALPLALNDGVDLPLLESRDGWANVELPDGESIWLAPRAWAALVDGARDAPFRVNHAVTSVDTTLELPVGAESPQWSPDGSKVAFMLRRDLRGQIWQAQGIWLFYVAERRTRSIAHGRFFNPHMSWSLDGLWVAFERYEGDVPVVEIAGAETPAPKLIAEGVAPAWSPAANQLTFFRPDYPAEELWRINSDRTAAKMLVSLAGEGFQSDFRPTRPAAWAPSGDRLVVGAEARHYEDGVARLIFVSANAEGDPTVLGTPAQQFRGLSWSPDGEKVACVLAGHTGRSLGDPLDQRVTVYWPDASHAPVSVPHRSASWVADDYLAYVELPTMPGAPSKVWLMDVTTEQRTLLFYAEETVTSLAWVPDRQRLCVWSTSDYVRNGRYQPALTKGWLLRIDVLPSS